MSTLFSYFFEKINQIRPQEANFTKVLSSIAVMPEMLYYYGKIPENMVKTVAIVGSRHNTRYGEEVAYKISYELAKRGVIIVSGLAFGIDSIAHRAALDAGGTTIAILGTPINEIYPRNHLPLAKEIVEKGGAVMSEYGPKVKCYPESSSFLQRNRIISGLSDVVIVVEAAEKSGSLNTATHALNQGKEIFAVPGNINNPYSKGCNKLIKEGANPYTELDDVLKVLFPEQFVKKKKKVSQPLLFGDSEEELKILKALSEGIENGEEIIKKTGLSTEIFNETITLLEIKDSVSSLGANNWMLK